MMGNIFTINFTIGFSSLYGILTIVAKWLILDKLGEQGWKAIIPFYGDYLICSHIWNKTCFWANLLTGIIGGIIVSVGLILIPFVEPAVWILGFSLGLTLLIANFVICIMFYNKLSKAFGHGTGYTVGLVIFQPLFMLMIGLEKEHSYGGYSQM